MKSRVMLAVLLLVSFVSTAVAGSYNYISPENMKKNIETGVEQIIVDIQVEDNFSEKHIVGSVPTYSYPVKTDAEKAKINEAVALYQAKELPVVIVCPRGKGGAKRCYDYMQSQGVPAEKLFILEKGIDGWPYADLTQASK